MKLGGDRSPPLQGKSAVDKYRDLPLQGKRIADLKHYVTLVVSEFARRTV